MLISNESQLSVGMDLFRASWANGGTYASVEAYKLNALPHVGSTANTGKFVKVNKESLPYQGQTGTSLSYDINLGQWYLRNNPPKNLSTQFSIRDAGVDQHPKYNDHGLYTSLAEAMKHIEDMAGGGTAPRGGHSILTTITPELEPEESPNDAYERAMGVL